MSETMTLVRGLVGVALLFGAANPDIAPSAEDIEKQAAGVAGVVSAIARADHKGAEAKTGDGAGHKEARLGAQILAKGLDATSETANEDDGDGSDPTEEDFEKVLRGEPFHKEFSFSEWRNREVRCTIDFDGSEGRFACALEGDGETDMSAEDEERMRRELAEHGQGRFYLNAAGEFCFEEGDGAHCDAEPSNHDDREYRGGGQYREEERDRNGDYRDDGRTYEADRHSGRDGEWREKHGDFDDSQSSSPRGDRPMASPGFEEYHKGNYHEFTAPDGKVRCSSSHEDGSVNYGCETEGNPCFGFGDGAPADFCPPPRFTCVEGRGVEICRDEDTGATFSPPRDRDHERDREGRGDRAAGYGRDYDMHEKPAHEGRNHPGPARVASPPIQPNTVNVYVTVNVNASIGGGVVGGDVVQNGMPCTMDANEAGLPYCGAWSHCEAFQPTTPTSTCGDDVEYGWHNQSYADPPVVASYPAPENGTWNATWEYAEHPYGEVVIPAAENVNSEAVALATFDSLVTIEANGTHETTAAETDVVSQTPTSTEDIATAVVEGQNEAVEHSTGEALEIDDADGVTATDSGDEPFAGSSFAHDEISVVN